MNKLKTLAFYAGIAIFAAGIAAIIFIDTEDIMRLFPAVTILSGTLLISASIPSMLGKNPKLAKELEIHEKDERNIRLREKAGYSTWFVTQFVLMAMMITFVILDYKLPGWIAVGALFIHNASLIAGIFIHNKKM